MTPGRADSRTRLVEGLSKAIPWVLPLPRKKILAGRVPASAFSRQRDGCLQDSRDGEERVFARTNTCNQQPNVILHRHPL